MVRRGAPYEPAMKTPLILAVLFFPQPAQAGFSGNQVQQWCLSAQEFAGGYAAGMVDSLHQEVNGIRISCPDPTVSVAQMRDVLCRYISEHPETRHYNASALGLEAFSKAFPCRTGSP